MGARETKPTGAELKAVMDFPDTPPYPNNENGRYRMIDLFAGIGGTRLGFHQTNAVNVVFPANGISLLKRHIMQIMVISLMGT